MQCDIHIVIWALYEPSIKNVISFLSTFPQAKDQEIKEKDPTSRKSTKKVNCPAAIYIKKVAFFPDYQVILR